MKRAPQFIYAELPGSGRVQVVSYDEGEVVAIDVRKFETRAEKAEAVALALGLARAKRWGMR